MGGSSDVCSGGSVGNLLGDPAAEIKVPQLHLGVLHHLWRPGHLLTGRDIPLHLVRVPARFLTVLHLDFVSVPLPKRTEGCYLIKEVP